MPSSYTQKYRYGDLVVEVIRQKELPKGMALFKCLVRGFGQGNPAQRKKYDDIQTETNAKASRLALQMYQKEYGQNKQ